MKDDLLIELVELSNRYGKNPDYVLGGGGNTSVKTETHLYVKASGYSLGDITADGFCKMEQQALLTLAFERFEGNDRTVEAQVLARMMEARAPGEEKRPSVEAMLHALFPQRFVLHLHPALLNGLTCARQGEVTARILFGEEMLWIPEIKPGFTLASRAAADLKKFREKKGHDCALLFLQNHGVFFAADDVEVLDRLFDLVYQAAARFSPTLEADNPAKEGEEALKALLGCDALLLDDSPRAKAALETPDFERLPTLTPDHMVYCGSRLLKTCRETLKRDAEAYRQTYGKAPRIIGIAGQGVYAAGKSQKEAQRAMALFRDGLKVIAYTQASGGTRYMSDFLVNFISHWEVENYRSKQ